MHPCELPPDVLEGMREDPNHRHADPDSFSPTSLLDCDRKHGLTIGRDWYVNVTDAWPMLRGTLVHSLMQSNRYPGAVGVLREIEMEVEIETAYGMQRFAGQPDLVVVNRLEETEEATVAYVTVVDYKSTSEIKHDLIAARQDHVRQINMYAWLVRRWLPKHHSRPNMRVEVEELQVVYLDFKKVRRFTSAGTLSAKGKRLNRTRPYQYEELTLAALPLFSDEMVGRKIAELIENKLLAREELPPAYEIDDPEHWRCNYCPVASVCRELAEQGI